MCSRRRNGQLWRCPTPTRPHARAAYTEGQHAGLSSEPIPIKRDLSRLKMGPSVPRVPTLHPPINLNLLCSPGPCPTRPPLIAEGHRQTSVLPKAPVVRPRVPKKSCSVVIPGANTSHRRPSTAPPSPRNLSNGFTMSVEAGAAAQQNVSSLDDLEIGFMQNTKDDKNDALTHNEKFLFSSSIFTMGYFDTRLTY